MKVQNGFKLFGITMFIALGLAACDNNPGPAESAGKAIDATATEAGKNIGDAMDKVGEKLSDQGDKTGAVIDDAEITAKVKAAIFAEPGLRTLQISVVTEKGIVILSGSVDSPSNSDRAGALAAAVSGVKNVENRLVAKPI